jgi:hypothetical protein
MGELCPRAVRSSNEPGCSLGAVLGVVLILLALFVVGPFAIFVGGAVWSALIGWFASDDADRRAAQPQESTSG